MVINMFMWDITREYNQVISKQKNKIKKIK